MLRWLVLVFALTGCVSDPVMELYGARVTYASPAGLGMDMTMKVTNPNVFDVHVRNVSVRVVLAERWGLPPIQIDPNQWLRAGGATIVHVPVVIPWNLITPLIAATASSNTVKYNMKGSADLVVTRAFGFSFKRYGLDEDGEFTRGQLLMAAGRGILSGP
jgi:LEA14-like dessication related protein